MKTIRIWLKKSFFLTSFLLLCSCSITRPLSKTLNENAIIIVANYKWIGKIGKKTISEYPAMPILKNVDSDKEFKPKHYDKNFTYFTDLDKGNYIVERVILDGGQVKLNIKTFDKTRAFKVEEPGAYYIGGVDIIDTQFKIEYNVHDDSQNEQNLEKIKNILLDETNFSQKTKVQLIKNVQIKEKW